MKIAPLKRALTVLLVSLVTFTTTAMAAPASTAHATATTAAPTDIQLPWPYKPAQTAQIKRPFMCGMPFRPGCRDWDLYKEMYYDVKFGGGNSYNAVAALAAATGIHPNDAYYLAGVAYSTRNRCALDVRAQMDGLLNDQYRKGLFATQMFKLINRAVFAKFKKITWLPVSAVLGVLTDVAMREFSRQRVTQILGAAWSRGC